MINVRKICLAKPPENTKHYPNAYLMNIFETNPLTGMKGESHSKGLGDKPRNNQVKDRPVQRCYLTLLPLSRCRRFYTCLHVCFIVSCCIYTDIILYRVGFKFNL